MRLTRKEISYWLIDKNIRVWRRALYLLYTDDPLPLAAISDILGTDPAGTERQLKKMQIDRWVVRKNHKWYITNTGERKVEHYKKYGSMPILKLG
jgi:predicted transcriptional regulator